jgi:Co/Zn/Cd efflux system component
MGVNLICAMMLAPYRAQGGSLTRAAFLSARNDVLANVAIVVAGFATVYSLTAWPDLIVGLGIFLMNLDAAREVYLAALKERAQAVP